jgi:hypothetical protein
MPFIAAEMSVVAAAFKSVGVNSGASRLRLMSCVFFAVSVVVTVSPLSTGVLVSQSTRDGSDSAPPDGIVSSYHVQGMRTTGGSGKLNVRWSA